MVCSSDINPENPNACIKNTPYKRTLFFADIAEKESDITTHPTAQFSSSDITDFEQLVTDWQKKLPAVAKNAVRLDADTREFLSHAEKEGGVIPCDDLPKSYVVAAEYGFQRVYLTALNTATLEKRLK